MKTNIWALNIRHLFRNQFLLIATLLVASLLSTAVLVSPSHPFIDENGDGVDDFEQNAGRYQDPAEKAEAYGVTFPIAELGNCSDYLSCRTYCEDPVNTQACIDYGRSKGFYQGESDEKVSGVLAQAKTTLGCDSYAACQNFCEVEANYDRCAAFARSQGVVGGYVDDPSKSDILAKAKEVLGCSSPDACKTYCEQEANRDKCSQFAKQVGLSGGEHQIGPGGCTSETTCKAFCSDPNNYQICSGFSSTSGGTFTGPGGCNSEASCRTYCQQNEDECRKGFGGPGGSPPPGYNPQEMCNRTPNCSWTNNTCQCGFYGETQESAQKAGEYAAFCQTNPDKCRIGQPGSFESSDQRQEFERYCSQNPEKCRPPSGGSTGTSPDPATECVRYGCSWTNNSCQCSGYPTYTPFPQPTSGSYTPPSAGSYDPATECAKTSGCSWNGSYCQCSGSSGGGSYEDPATACAKTSGCSWNGSSCQCSSTTGSTSSTPQPTSSSTETQSQTQTSQESTSTQDPATACTSTSGCSWTGSSCQCGSTQGVSTDRGLLQIILEWLEF